MLVYYNFLAEIWKKITQTKRNDFCQAEFFQTLEKHTSTASHQVAFTKNGTGDKFQTPIWVLQQASWPG
jgi:hypothetical protein